MELRHAFHPEFVRGFDTNRLRNEFLVEEVFVDGTLTATYTLTDRLIIIGAVPAPELTLEVDTTVTGTDFLLERREMGVINLGGPGAVTADGTSYSLNMKEGLYIARGTREVAFRSESASEPARFYCLSGPAHDRLQTAKFVESDANQVHLGSDEECNRRTIFQQIHPGGIKSCNVVMGYTVLAPRSVWNTMSSHTHLRRMEAYFYFDVPDEARVFHFMGEPTQTRHLVLRNEQAVISPSWSIHAGVGTREYSFVWGMLGENQRFDDMDHVSMDRIR